MNNLILRETISKYSSDLLSDVELISLILGERVASKMKENSIYTLKNLVRYSDGEIKGLLSISDVTLSKVKALFELSTRNTNDCSDKISSPKDVVKLSADMEHYEQEVLRMYCLNSKNKVIKTMNLFKGGISSAIVDVRIVFKEALKCNASAIMVCHNHPSGDPTNSRDDLLITERLKQSGEIVGIKLLDHIIVGSNNTYFSFVEKGLI
ncbi:MAG: JAB domain-containing protein [Clostridium sp.]